MMPAAVKKIWMLSGICFLAFLLLLFAVLFVDVQPIGPDCSSVGLASINQMVHRLTGTNGMWYQITEVLGYLVLCLAAGFACLGGWQLLRRRSLRKVDTDLILLGVCYVETALFYCIFEVLVVNTRPVLLDGMAESSFPSSHTMLAVCILATAIFQFLRRITARGLRTAVCMLCGLLTVILVTGRLLSGVHWFTDILGGILLSSSLVFQYLAMAASCGKAKDA